MTPWKPAWASPWRTRIRRIAGQGWLGGRFEPNRPPNPRPGSGQVEAVEVHDLVPRRHEVTHELLLPVVRGVDLRDRPELRVGPEDDVGRRGGPLLLAGGAVHPVVHVLLRGGGPPLGPHVEEVHEEVRRSEERRVGKECKDRMW